MHQLPRTSTLSENCRKLTLSFGQTAAEYEIRFRATAQNILTQPKHLLRKERIRD